MRDTRRATARWALLREGCLLLGLPFGTLFLIAAATEAQPLTVELVALTSPVSPWGSATIEAQTAPGAECRIAVFYKSGLSRAKGLVPKVADRQGRVSWTWIVGSKTTPGIWPITVTCSAGAREGTLRTSFRVH